MKWRIVKKDEVPLGFHTIVYGSHGRAVRELQEELARSGFFTGLVDGLYGPLTEEAVLLAEKAFGLPADGIAGPRLLAALKDPSRINGRLVYVVKYRENIQAIAERFGVTPGAMAGISSRSNPRNGIYPGMQLLVYEKALLVWDQSYNGVYGCNISGRIRSDWRLDKDFKLNFSGEESAQPEAWHLITAESAVWAELLATNKAWPTWVQGLERFQGLQFGLDLRELPVNRISRAVRVIRFLMARFKLKAIPFLALPLIQAERGLGGWRWGNLAELAGLSRWILLEPMADHTTPERFLSTSAASLRGLRLLTRFGLNGKVLLICSADGRDWEEDSGASRSVHFKKGRILHAMNPRSAAYDSDAMLRVVHYIADRKRHCLIYRDIAGWGEFLRLLNRRMVLGVVIRNFNHLGSLGPQLIADAFAVLPRIR